MKKLLLFILIFFTQQSSAQDIYWQESPSTRVALFCLGALLAGMGGVIASIDLGSHFYGSIWSSILPLGIGLSLAIGGILLIDQALKTHHVVLDNQTKNQDSLKATV